MTKRDEIKQILVDMAYTPDAKPRFINEKWVKLTDDRNLRYIDEAVEKLLVAFEPSPEDIAYEILCCDDEYPLKDMIELIQDQDAVDGSMLIDYVEGVQVWEKLQYEFTCSQFLKHISLKS